MQHAQFVTAVDKLIWTY